MLSDVVEDTVLEHGGEVCNLPLGSSCKIGRSSNWPKRVIQSIGRNGLGRVTS